jgi:hypothetical protein
MSEHILAHKHQTHNHAAHGWRIHCNVEVTEWSTNKQHTLSHMIAGGSGDGQQVLVVVASVVEQEVAGGLEKRQRGSGGTVGGARVGVLCFVSARTNKRHHHQGRRGRLPRFLASARAQGEEQSRWSMLQDTRRDSEAEKKSAAISFALNSTTNFEPVWESFPT